MVARTDEGPVLLVKKLGGLFLIVLGCILLVAGSEPGINGIVSSWRLVSNCRLDLLGSQDHSAQ